MVFLDQFESRFNRAAKETFTFTPHSVGRILVVTDRDSEGSQRVVEEVQRFLAQAPCCVQAEWSALRGSDFNSVQELFARIQTESPDLVVTYRNLKEPEPEAPFTLGAYLDVLTQLAPMPVLVVPDLEDDALASMGTKEVMVVTDHLTGENRLVNMGVSFARPDGKLFLVHVEDDMTFERYMGVIGKLPSLDTETAREDIQGQLLRDPQDFIASCREALAEAGVQVAVESIVRMGHHVREYRALIEEHEVDLLVFNTKDESQMAMHGLAYPLAVELRRTPLLML